MANPEINNYVPTIIYNVLIKDRHCDAVIHNFRDKDKAIMFAREAAVQWCDSLEHYIETSYENGKNATNWILHIEASCEDDYVIVSRGELK